jgi:hypothetical protein
VKVPSDPVVRPAVWGTAVFVIVSALAVADGPLRPFVALFDLVLFVLGCLVFVRTLLMAAERSRTEELSVAGIWFLNKSAPPDIQRWLLGSLAVETVAAFVTAGMRPYTSLAFGVLVPMFGLGLCGLWAVRSGSFPPRSSHRTD